MKSMSSAWWSATRGFQGSRRTDFASSCAASSPPSRARTAETSLSPLVATTKASAYAKPSLAASASCQTRHRMRMAAVARASARGCLGVMLNVSRPGLLLLTFAAHISFCLDKIGPTPPPSPASARVSEAISNKHDERGLLDTGKRQHDSMTVSTAINDSSETETEPLPKRQHRVSISSIFEFRFALVADYCP